MLKAVIFDFDGVVADSEPLHYKALNEVFAAYGVNVSKEEHWEKYLGYNDLQNVEAVSRDYGMGLDESQVNRIIRQKTELFDELVRTQNCIIDGVAEFIAMLKQDEITMAVCSGALRCDIELMLDGSGFENSFDTIVAADDVKKGKPDPESYLLVLCRLNEMAGNEILPTQCVVVEDSHWGLEAAAAAQMHRLAVTNTYPPEELGRFAEKIVNNLRDVAMDELNCLCGD